MQTSSRQQRSLQVECCRSRAHELEKVKRSLKTAAANAKESEDGYPHLVEASSSRKTEKKQNSKAWELQPACMPEREQVIRTREGK